MQTRSGLVIDYIGGKTGPDWMSDPRLEIPITSDITNTSEIFGSDTSEGVNSTVSATATTEMASPIYQAIRTPILQDTTCEACYKFNSEYQKYKRGIEQRNITMNTRIMVIPVKECIPEKLF